MRPFIRKFLSFSVVVLLLATVADLIITYGYRKTRIGKVKNGLVNSDILIIGTSRAYRHFDTDYLKSQFGKSAFNLGFDASGFETQCMLLNFYLSNNHKPETIIWEVNYNFFIKDSTVYKYDELIPFVRDSIVYSYLHKKQLVDFKDYYVPFHRFLRFKLLVKRSIHNYVFDDARFESDYKIQDLPWDGRDFNTKYLKAERQILVEPDREYIRAFKDLIYDLKRKNIRVVFVFTPIYSGIHAKLDGKDQLIANYHALFKDINAPFLDYTHHEISSDTANFYNALHMNSTGVYKFLPEFCRDLQSELD